MSVLTPEDVIEQAAWFEDVAMKMLETATMLRESAAKMRESQQMLTIAVQDGTKPDAREIAEAALGVEKAKELMTLRAMPGFVLKGRSRIEQLNSILGAHGPLQRNSLIDIAHNYGIPKNTSAAYITREHFIYRDGYWYVKGQPWPEKQFQRRLKEDQSEK